MPAAARARPVDAARRAARARCVCSSASSTARFARSPIACTATSSPPRLARSTSSRSSGRVEQQLAGPAVGVGLEHRRGARAERAVGEGLDRADAQEVVAEARAQAERERVVEPLDGQRGPDAERERAVGREPLPGGEAVRALEVVDARHAATVRRADAAAHGGVELLLGRQRRALPEREGVLLAQQAGSAGGGGGDRRVPVVRADRARAVAARRLEAGGVERRREVVAQRVARAASRGRPAPRRSRRTRPRGRSRRRGRAGRRRAPTRGSARARRGSPARRNGRRDRSARTRRSTGRPRGRRRHRRSGCRRSRAHASGAGADRP